MHGVLLIAAITSTGIMLSFSEATIDADGMGGLIAAMLAIVAVVALLQTRFLLLPSMVKAFRAQTTPATLVQFERNVSLIVLAFSTAPAVYGLVSAFYLDAWWPPLPFGAFACLTLAATYSYAQQQIETLRREASMRGET